MTCILELNRQIEDVIKHDICLIEIDKENTAIFSVRYYDDSACSIKINSDILNTNYESLKKKYISKYGYQIICEGENNIWKDLKVS